MIPIVCFVGRTNAGKTSVLEKVIADFKSRGYRLAVVKHDVHGFELDREGKDSWKLKQAGATEVILSSPSKVGIIRDVESDTPLDEIRARYVGQVDLIIAEGYKRDSHPKVEVSREEVSRELLCGPDDNLIAVISDYAVATDAACFGLDETSKLVDFLADRFLQDDRKRLVRLRVNGRSIHLKDFVQEAIAGTLRGLVSTLRGARDPKSILVEVDGEDRGEEKD